MTVDLNADLGEGAGHDEEILTLVSSANIACGFHAGTPSSILHSIRLAMERGVAVGAHPSFDDRKNFGRTEMNVPPGEVYALVAFQVGAFRALCEAAGTEMRHVKPHGALYNMAARDRAMADAVAHAVLAAQAKTLLFVPPRSALEDGAGEIGLQAVREFFADRAYQPDGALVSRSHPDAILPDPGEAAQRVVRMLREKKVRTSDGTDFSISAETICVHGDTPGAVDFVRTLRAQLERENIRIAAPDSLF